MLNTTQYTRLGRKCANALAAAVDSLPGLLDQAEPEAAAAIVADLVKALVARPLPEPDPMEALNKVIRLARENAERDAADCPPDPEPAPDYPRTCVSEQPVPFARPADPAPSPVSERRSATILASSSLYTSSPDVRPSTSNTRFSRKEL